MYSSYFESLDYGSQKRYVEKLKAPGVEIPDPYSIADDLWIDNPAKWPDVEFGDIYTYLIDTKGTFTKESLKAYKSLEAYNYFYNGYVHTVYYYSVSQGICVLKARVNPSQKAPDKGHSPWIAINSGDLGCCITVAHCTCMAGLGEVCSHVAALLFKVEAACRLGYTNPSRTSLPCRWNNDFKTAVKPAEVVNIEFVKPKHAQKRKHPSTQQSVQSKLTKVFTGPHDSPKTQKKEWTDTLYQLVPNACLYTIVPGPDPSGSAVPSLCTVTTSLSGDIGTSAITTTAPLTIIPDNVVTITPNGPVTTVSGISVTTVPDNLVNIIPNDPPPTSTALPVVSVPIPKALTELYDENYRLLNEDLLRKAIEVFRSIRFSNSECKAIEASTRLQRNCEEWGAQRRGRITASCFHDVYVLKDSTSPRSLCMRLLSPKDLSHIPAIKWGIDNEDKARQQYTKEMSTCHQNFCCEPCGLVVNPLYPHLGASPDGTISCSCCGTGLLEIKCPYNVSNSHPDALHCINKSFLNSQGLVHTHKYYTQVQGQLLLCQKQFCDSVVWTMKGLIIERVYIDVQFTEKLSKKLTDFYVQKLLPEILTHRYTGNDPEMSSEENEDRNKLYCICRSPEYGKMIRCDHPECQYEWFHYKCVGIRQAPRGKWFCPNCI